MTTYLEVPRGRFRSRQFTSSSLVQQSSYSQSSLPNVSVRRSLVLPLPSIPETKIIPLPGELVAPRPVKAESSYAYSVYAPKKCYYCGYRADSNFYAPASGKWRPFCNNECFQRYKKW